MDWGGHHPYRALCKGSGRRPQTNRREASWRDPSPRASCTEPSSAGRLVADPGTPGRVQAADYGDGYVHRRVPREKMKLVTPTAGISMGFGRDRVESAGSDQLKNEGKG